MKLTNLLPLIRKNNYHNGATLIELLLGSSLSSFVVGLAGWGLVHSTTLDQKASAKGDIQYNSNRALEFIADEVKLGTKIESDAVGALSEAPDFTLPNGAKPILVVQVQGLEQPVIYYTKQAEGIWDGPYMMERWGPDFNAEGEYYPTQINDPKTWKAHVVMDRIDDTPETPNCPRDWRASNSNSTRGFNACVNPNEKLVKLNIATTVDNKTWQNNVNYQVETMAFARSSMFTIISKKLIPNTPSDITFEVLGGEITCGTGGGNIPVQTNLYINENKQTWNTNSALTLPNQAAGTTFDVESISGDGSICNGLGMTVSTTDENTSQLQVLVNGDDVPNITPFANQNTIDFFLQQYVENGKIKIAENQAIYLFELGVTNQNSPAFDLQDNVVLATVEPSN
ncbi:hypothetical protein [Crocosphaera sp.]|uniref:hypothetical protein n=1 Tax=Crocosphaera sp. TaxID=2729996 RepID=UPI002613E1EC|nr:hypothetical protein [Crocosphaera sp.]MDJ0582301.1 hypothetical protein [Crocosphaera sp.]